MRNTVIVLITLVIAVLFFGQFFVPAPTNMQAVEPSVVDSDESVEYVP